MVMQIHYNLANGAFADRTTVDLALADSVLKEATISQVSANGFSLPPGQALVAVNGQLQAPTGNGTFTVWGVGPHMHQRGRTLDAWYEAGGKKTCLSKVTDWNFHWQGLATLSQPLTLEYGGMASIICGYDTLKDTMPILNGEGTGDEMCINFFYVTN
jgi:hypothetical protein